MISRHTSRLRQVLAPRNPRTKPAVPAQADREAVPADTPGRDVPVPELEADSLLDRLVHLAEAAEAAAPGKLVIDTPQSQRTAMGEVWRAYADVVNVLCAITRSARLVEMGVCVASQLAAIELLNEELEIVWARWDQAHRKVIGSQARRE